MEFGCTQHAGVCAWRGLNSPFPRFTAACLRAFFFSLRHRGMPATTLCSMSATWRPAAPPKASSSQTPPAPSSPCRASTTGKPGGCAGRTCGAAACWTACRVCVPRDGLLSQCFWLRLTTPVEQCRLPTCASTARPLPPLPYPPTLPCMSTYPGCSTPAPTGRGAAKPTSSQGSDLLPGGSRPQRSTRGSSRLKQKATAAAEASATQDDMLAVSRKLVGHGAQ